MKTVLVKYSTQRNERFQIMTSVVRDDYGKMMVKKEPITVLAADHVRLIAENGNRLNDYQQILHIPHYSFDGHTFQTDFVEGESLDQSLYRDLINKQYSAFEQELRAFRTILEQLPAIMANPSDHAVFRTIFGTIDHTYKCLTLGHIDLILENIIRSEDGVLWTIDYEWILDTCIPIDFILYRAAAIFLNKYQKLLTPLYSFEKLMDILGIADPDQIFRSWEDCFSHYVHDDSIYQYQKQYVVPDSDLLHWQQSLPTSLGSTLFYSHDGSFSEKQCIRSEIRRTQTVDVTYHFEQPVSWQYLRWDPCENMQIAIKSCKLFPLNGLAEFEVIDQFTANGFQLDDQIVYLHIDPQAIFTLPDGLVFDGVRIQAEIAYLQNQSTNSLYLKKFGEHIQKKQAKLNEYSNQMGLLKATIDQQSSRIIGLVQVNNKLDEQVVTILGEKDHLIGVNNLMTKEMDLLSSDMNKLQVINDLLLKEKNNIEKEKNILSRQQNQLELSYRHANMLNTELANSIEQLHHSLSWKITKPVRTISGLIKAVKNPLTRVCAILLKPVSSITQTPDGQYIITDEDPQFKMDVKIRKGLYLFSYDGMASKRLLLKLYLDYGNGFQESDSMALGHLNTEKLHHERFILFKNSATQVRLDPGEDNDIQFSLINLHYTRLGLISSIRIGLAMLSPKSQFSKPRLFVHMAKLYLTGRKHEVIAHFSGVFKDHGEGRMADTDLDAYQQYMFECEPDTAHLHKQKHQSNEFIHQPVISVIVPVYNTNKEMLVDMIESVRSQTYGKWELCLADGHSAKSYVAAVLEDYKNKDSRIKIILLDENLGIAGNTNAALSLASGDYIALLDHDDLLPAWALFSVVKAINANNLPDVLYSDEDKITFDGKQRFFPHFKPDWSPDLIRSYNYITHLFIAKRELVERAGCFLPGYDGSQDHDFILRTTEMAEKIIHIPEILYHWRSHSESTAESQGNKSYTLEAGVKAISSQLQRKGYKGSVESNQQFGFYRVNYALVERPLVTIIIPNYEHLQDFRRCINSILKKSTYDHYEILIVENSSTSREIFAFYQELEMDKRIRVIRWEHEFNYATINNFAAGQVHEGMILFLNNDTEVITPDWIEQMLQYAQRNDVGCVGARLYYADDTIQHAGVILGYQGIAGHAFSRMPKDSPGYMARSMVVQNVSAVTAACMLIPVGVFLEVGGFDENLKVAFNDIDLCMKITTSGKLIVYTPYAELYHHESISRGSEDTAEKQARFASEIAYFKNKWGTQLAAGDPYYNPHLDLELRPYRISGK